uniref:Uncharacterized protein n=1 Tax=Amphimedon queenslandica TaxID=400682 RepID=A0A1X7TW09_AMPQE
MYQTLPAVHPNDRRRGGSGLRDYPKVDAARSPRLDSVMKTVAPQSAQSVDKELARLQTFILDALAPLTAILEGTNEMTVQDIREALITASILIGNANAKLTRLRREKLISAINAYW